MAATLQEIRELSRRSRRAQRRGLLGMLTLLLAIPAHHILAPTLGTSWAAALAVTAGGATLVAYAHAVGEERGAFRRVFRRIADEKQETRTIVPGEAATAVARDAP